MDIEIVILAAGAGKRMRSQLPKVLHPLAGKAMIDHVLEAARQLSPKNIHVIYGHQAERLRDHLQDAQVNLVFQQEQLGTGHAVDQAMPIIADDSQVMVLCGDVPLITSNTLKKLCAQHNPQTVTLITAEVAQPKGLGRIIRNDAGDIAAIVEEKDADVKQKQISEIYSGILLAPASELKRWLPTLANNNAQGEYYLTEVVSKAVAQNMRVQSVTVECEQEIQGVNTRSQLIALERYYQYQQAQKLLEAGVHILDPARFDVRGRLQCGLDVSIDINCVFDGDVVIADGCQIGPNCLLRNVRLADGVVVKANSVIEDAEIGSGCQIGPFARIRPGTHLASGVRIGNFVEIKKSDVDENSKINHLSYIGDATIGKSVNVGAGTITCNYDGVNKHRTTIEDGAFIGSDTQLVAPVVVGANATIGAGSTIRKDAPAEYLSVNISEQKVIPGWRRPQKNNSD